MPASVDKPAARTAPRKVAVEDPEAVAELPEVVETEAEAVAGAAVEAGANELCKVELCAVVSFVMRRS